MKRQFCVLDSSGYILSIHRSRMTAHAQYARRALLGERVSTGECFGKKVGQFCE